MLILRKLLNLGLGVAFWEAMDENTTDIETAHNGLATRVETLEEQVGVPTPGSVTTEKLALGSVTPEKVAVMTSQSATYNANGQIETETEIDEHGTQYVTTYTYTNGVCTRIARTGGGRTIQEDLTYENGLYKSSTTTIL
ncbi:hypothetical protein [Bacillus sp. OTU530]|uniref:hypothetical protein n=1 Tax=Bacillus sp. OTU530 TaxID=3043862 RepID=UPI00313E3A74